MTDMLTFRTNDNTRWGQGQGFNLTASQIDLNFWVLYTALVAIQDHLDTTANIANIVVTGNQMSVILTNHVSLGPFTLPTAVFKFRGAWQANQSYNVNDVFQAVDGFGQQALWLVTFTVANSGATFNPNANDGAGHNWWVEVLAAPQPAIPLSGPTGGFLQLTNLPSPLTEWVLPTRNLGGYIESEPNPLEIVWAYLVTETLTFPQSLTAPNSYAKALTAPTVEQDYQILWNGANIGTIKFQPSPTGASLVFPHEIVMEPDDVIEIVAPSVPDPHLTGIKFTLVAQITPAF